MSAAGIPAGAERPFFDVAHVGQALHASADADTAAPGQPVQVYGVQCLLINDGGGSYSMWAEGQMLSRATQRLLAVAQAARVIRERHA